MIRSSKLERDAFNDIKLLLDYSHLLYKEYLKSNKKFIYSSILRKVNKKLYECLSKNYFHLTDKTHNDAIELMFHLDVWMAIWDHEYEEQRPKLWDIFTFNNDITFPREKST